MTAAFWPAGGAAWFTGRPWQPGLLIAHLDASPWNAVWADGALAGFVDWDTASHLSSDQRSTLAIRHAGIARPEMFASD